VLDPTSTEEMPVFSLMEVVDVSLELPSQYPTVSLIEVEGPGRTLTVPIGMAEGVALAHALRKIDTPRPLTHELFTEVLRRLNTDIAAVRLIGRRDGTYLAEADLIGKQGRTVVACRPSDGIVLALRQSVPAPILADRRLLNGFEDVSPIETPSDQS